MLTSTNFKPRSKIQSSLKSLYELGVLDRELIGRRYIIRASTNYIVPFGYNIEGVHEFIQSEPSLSNFNSDTRCLVRGFTNYRGIRAEILATTSDPHEYSSAGDICMAYPVNQLATAMLHYRWTKRAYFDRSIPAFGDAVLITDPQYHWILPKRTSSDEDFKMLDARLIAKHVLTRRHDRTMIVFIEEPHQHDISRIMLS